MSWCTWWRPTGCVCTWRDKHGLSRSELEALADKLPQTADGRYWVPGQDVEFYHPREAGSQDDVDIEDGRCVAWWWTVDRETGGAVEHSYDIAECYSTQKAAEAARKEAGS